jgi:hypothetical protein
MLLLNLPFISCIMNVHDVIIFHSQYQIRALTTGYIEGERRTRMFFFQLLNWDYVVLSHLIVIIDLRMYQEVSHVTT